MGWESETGEIRGEIESQREAARQAYKADPKLVQEHAGQELEAKSGGYGRRQVYELVQNAADQLDPKGGRIEVVLTKEGLYCANDGEPFSASGLSSILHAYVSPKEDEQIGRFGLGFKSVLGVTDTPLVLSRSGSFRFGADVAKSIAEVVPGADSYPLLRIAELVDGDSILKKDAVAKDLAKWAQTIVVLPFKDASKFPWLGDDIGGFPAAFLAFADRVERLVLVDRRGKQARTREITASRKGGTATIHHEGVEDVWLVFETEVPITDSARERAGKLADRDRVTVKWAVPPTRSKDLGEFWSFFPTDDRTTLRGVLNAPWHLSEDRRRLVEGSYNEELIAGAAQLVCDSLPALQKSGDDPSAYLELLPGRGKEGRSWGDDKLTEQTNRLLSACPSVPLLGGGLIEPARAEVTPEPIPERVYQTWAQVADTEGWVDPSIDLHKDRRARVVRYLELADSSEASLEGWFNALLKGAKNPKDAIEVALVADYLRQREDGKFVWDSNFVLTEDGDWVSPRSPALMLPGKYEARQSQVVLVDPDVANSLGAVQALRDFGVQEVSAAAELRRLALEAVGDAAVDWQYFWQVAREVTPDEAKNIVEEADCIPQVRTVDGDFNSLTWALIPGRCVPGDGSRDASVAVDEHWHAPDLRLLRDLGCTSGPDLSADVTREPWFKNYRKAGLEMFREVNAPASPSEDLVEIIPGSRASGPLGVMKFLSDEGRAAMSQLVIELMDTAEDWAFKHNSEKYKPAAVINPSLWMISEEGLFETPLGPKPIDSCVGPSLREGVLAPSVSCSTAVAQALDLPDAWNEVEEDIRTSVGDRALLADPGDAASLYVAWARAGIDPPSRIRCSRSGAPTDAPLTEVAVSDDSHVTDLLSEGSQAVLCVDDGDSKKALTDAWKLEDAADLVSRRVAAAETGERSLLVDVFPPLRKGLDQSQRKLQLQRCDEIRIVEEAVGGTRSVITDFVRDGDVLLASVDLSDSMLLRRLGRELGFASSDTDIKRVLKGVEDARTRAKMKSVRAAKSDSERLLKLLGAETLATKLPAAVLETFQALEGESTDLDVAKLALSIHGVDVVKVYEEELEIHGLHTPGQWAGSRRAREFVQSLGFPIEFAGFSSSNPPPEELIEGRPNVPPLHDYQVTIVEDVLDLTSRDRDNRAMLTLPTGAGKTRVAIEGLIDAVLDEKLGHQPILWVAQSNELCEQAVAAWAEMWRATDTHLDLTVSRLWSTNGADRAPTDVQVVVATIDKLMVVHGTDEYSWLKEPAAVVIDEAHRSNARSYTELFHWLGLGGKKFGPPLLGLSATPFKGRDKAATQRLASRYGNLRLDHRALGKGDHYPRLQELKVISEVDHEVLEGSKVQLTDKQKKVASEGLLPTDAENELGKDVRRTERVIESIAAQPNSWPILVFAPSVENAQTLAGLLTHQGISAAAISGETPMQARRWYVHEFREGRLRVLTNYGVFAEGFDAPQVRAVYVARPVFAPNQYQQMVGRGLRGPKNGGKDRCLIVDVEDNFVNFDGKLAFPEFEYLWKPSSAKVGAAA